MAGTPLVVAQLVCAATAFRGWAAAHPQEFSLVVGTPVPFLRLWAERPFPVQPDDALPRRSPPSLGDYRESLTALFGEAAARVPLAAINTFLRAWVQLDGLVAMDVFDHLHFCPTDAEPFFETRLAAIGQTLGIHDVPDR